jgi:hypothetical protein
MPAEPTVRSADESLASADFSSVRRWLRHGNAAAVAWVRRHPHLSLSAAGFAAACVTVVAGGRVGTVRTVIPLTNWFGLFPRNTHPRSVWIPSTVLLGGVIALVLVWLLALRVLRAGRTSERTVWAIGAVWATPFIVGPPLLSNDVYTYAAQGLLLRDGLDPYRVGPAALGNVRALAAVDPSWRSVPSPYGPLASIVQHLAIAISGGSPLGAVIVFRALGVLCLVAVGLLALEVAGPRRVSALTLTVLNPLLLLQVVSAAHLDGVMCALVLAAVVAGSQRRWTAAIVLAAAAGSVKAPAYIAVLAVIAVHQGVPGRGVEWRTLLRDAAVGAAAVFAFALAVPDGWGWTRALTIPALGHTSLAPASLLADLISPVVRAASFDDLAAGGRITALIGAGVICLVLLATADRRGLERTTGYGLLAVGALSPVVYPWYLLGGVVCLLPTARHARRDWLVLVSGTGCLLSPPGFSTGVSTGVSIATLAVALAMIAPRTLARRRARLAGLPLLSVDG